MHQRRQRTAPIRRSAIGGTAGTGGGARCSGAGRHRDHTAALGGREAASDPAVERCQRCIGRRIDRRIDAIGEF
jgi:hypothetical protein